MNRVQLADWAHRSLWRATNAAYSGGSHSAACQLVRMLDQRLAALTPGRQALTRTQLQRTRAVALEAVTTWKARRPTNYGA